MTDETRPYPRKQFVRVVNVSALIGWCAFVAVVHPTYLPTVIYALIMLAMLAVIGLPIALMVSWVLASQSLWRLMARPLGWGGAIAWGLMVSAPMVIIAFCLEYFGGLHIGGVPPDHALAVLFTPFGLRILAQDAGIVVVAALAIAVATRALTGRKKMVAA